MQDWTQLTSIRFPLLLCATPLGDQQFVEPVRREAVPWQRDQPTVSAVPPRSSDLRPLQVTTT